MLVKITGQLLDDQRSRTPDFVIEVRELPAGGRVQTLVREFARRYEHLGVRFAQIVVTQA